MSLLSGVKKRKVSRISRSLISRILEASVIRSQKGEGGRGHLEAPDLGAPPAAARAPLLRPGCGGRTHFPQTQSDNCLLHLQSVAVTVLLQTLEAVGPE